MTARAPWINSVRRYASPRLLMPCSTFLPPLEFCGNPNCHCARDPAARHGPYYEWSYLKGARLHHRTLTPKQAELMRLAIANYRKAKKLLRTWETHTQRLIELNAPE